MIPIRRRRLPQSIRSLLTDIGPKEDWQPEPEPEAREGILVPARGATSGHRDFLAPAKRSAEENTGRMCMLCQRKPSCYTCPRCNLHYCGLTCYRSPDHSACSEEFYKESVLHELKDMGKTEADGRRKMQEILLGLRQKAHTTDGGMKSLLQEVGVLQDSDAGDPEQRVQAVELLSRLAEIQESAAESDSEIEEILRKLEALGGGDDVEDECLVDQLSPLDIDKLSEEELWALLNNKEKEKFMGLLRGGAIGGLVPIWKPWWEEHENSGQALVEVLQGDLSNTTSLPSNKSEHRNVKPKKAERRQQSGIEGSKKGSNVPPISSKIPQLRNLCANPSPLVCYSLVNVLFCYTFTLFLFNGDTDSLKFEFIDMILSVSEAFNSSRVFSSVQEGLACGQAKISGAGVHLEMEDSGAVVRAVEAVAHILTGRDRADVTGYCLAALSQLRSVFHQARSGLSKEGDEGLRRQKYFLGGKKCEFFQAWVLGNSSQIRLLAIELWNEHGRRVHELNLMNQSKSAVEESLKKGKKEGKILIEELKP
ncbi:zinc finger HIT domain-containing protein 2 [Synchiropus picturatus]